MLELGDSGAWVVDEDTGDLYGHIVAGRPGGYHAYIIPAQKTFTDLEARLHCEVSLPEPSSIDLNTFRSKLKGWKQRPHCEKKGHENNCNCRRRPSFYRTTLLEQWMLRKEQHDGEKTNMERLLDEMKEIKVSFATRQHLIEGPRRCVLTLSILITQYHEKLIYLFQAAGIVDEDLEVSVRKREKLTEALRKRKYNGKEIDEIIRGFERKRWAFSPVHFDLEMDETFTENLVLPFCSRSEVNGKGGTASVSQVLVQEEFVSNEMKEHLTGFNDPDYGKVSSTEFGAVLGVLSN